MLSEHEGFGVPLIEAMSHGLAVVAAGSGAQVETVADAGLLFPPGDAEAAARELTRLVDEPGLLSAVGHALRARQQERYSLPLHLDRLEALYAAVAAGHPVGSGPQPLATARS